MSISKIVIYKHPNPEIRSFITSEEVSPPRVEYFKKPIDNRAEDLLNRLGIIGSQIVRETIAIPGVVDIRIKPKEILLKKERSYSWSEIEKPVVEILNRALRKKQIRIVKK